MENLTFKEKVKEVNKVLEQGEKNGNFTADHKGYTGYKPQYVLDAVNSQFCGEWEVEIVEKETVVTKKKDNSDGLTALMTIRLTLNSKKIETMASHPVLDDIGDAFKSAQTDALKKAFAHFSIGNRAYHGLLKK
jgi:hypothetical protein